jgi:hypothetical protein
MITHLLNRTATWRRNQPVGDHGRFQEVPVTLGTVAVRIQIRSATQKTGGFADRADATHTVYTDPDAAFKQGDILMIDGVRYDVIAKEPPSKPDHHIRWAVIEYQTSEAA